VEVHAIRSQERPSDISETRSKTTPLFSFRNSGQELIAHIREVLKRNSQAGVTIKASKCEFATAEVEYLGQTIGLGKVAPRSAKIRGQQTRNNFSHSLA